MFNDYTVSGAFMVYGNWAVYLVDIPALGVADLLSNLPWNGLIDSIRFDPILDADKDIKIDWIRLVEKGAAYEQTVTWTGNAGAVDIYLDNDNIAANGNLGLLAKDRAGSSYTFLAGGLAGGDYYVAVAPAGTQTYSYSPGYFHVNDQPVLSFTKPTEEGSDDDFATVHLGNAWDMNAAGDIDLTVNVSNPQFTTLSYEDRAGQVFNGNTVFKGLSDPAEASNVGDPHVFFMNFFYRGSTTQIDPSRYHNLSFKMGVAGAHSTNDGSQARIVWKLVGEAGENVSKDVVIRHLADRWIMEKFVCDLRTLPLEDGGASPSHSGWTGSIDSFRLDPHEFSDPREFFFDDVRITADWRADASFPVLWTAQDADAATVALYYDTDKTGYNGTLIAQGLNAAAGTYTWDTSAVPNGTYYLYAVISDGTNENRTYAGGPVIVLHGGTAVPIISLSKTRLVFGAAQNGAATGTEDVVLTNTGQGTLNWQAAVNANWISVTPTAGTGNAVLKIGISRTDMAPGQYTGMVSVQDGSASNSPQFINVTLNVYAAGGADAAPFGSFDRPAGRGQRVVQHRRHRLGLGRHRGGQGRHQAADGAGAGLHLGRHLRAGLAAGRGSGLSVVSASRPGGLGLYAADQLPAQRGERHLHHPRLCPGHDGAPDVAGPEDVPLRQRQRRQALRRHRPARPGGDGLGERLSHRRLGADAPAQHDPHRRLDHHDLGG